VKKKLRYPKKNRKQFLDKNGAEVHTSKPTKIHSKIKAPMTLRTKMTQMWKEFAIKQEETNSEETLQDASDFDVENDVFPTSPYEVEESTSSYFDRKEAELASEAEAQAQQIQEPVKEEQDVEVSSENSEEQEV
jgi:hypothetical protein